MGDGWCGSCASGLLSCVSCCSSIEFVVAVVGASIYHVDVHIHFLVVGGVGGAGGDIKKDPTADGSRLGNWPTRHPTLRLCWCASAMM